MLLNRQLAQAKTLLRSMQDTIEDIEDAKVIERAKRANDDKPKIPWDQVKREFEFDFLTPHPVPLPCLDFLRDKKCDLDDSLHALESFQNKNIVRATDSYWRP